VTGTELVALRSALGLAPFQMAGILGASISTYYRWEAYGRGTFPADDRALQLLQVMRQQAEARRTMSQRSAFGEALKAALVLGGGLLAAYVLLDALFPDATKRQALGRGGRRKK